MTALQLIRNGIPVTWGEMGAALTQYCGEERARATVEALRGWEGILNYLDQCGDLRRLSGPVDGSLVTGGEVPYAD